MNTDREYSEQQTKQTRWGFRGMTVRDWLPIVGALLIPIMVALGTGGITWQQARLEDRRAEQAQKIENQRAEAERQLAEQRAQDEALQVYLDQMGNFLRERDLRTSKEDSEVRTLARARTLTVLGRLDPSRKKALMQFLVEADLVQRVDGRYPIISLRSADLSDANLRGFLTGAPDLSGADLSQANLSDANLSGADLRGAHLIDANLNDAYLGITMLRYANALLIADLSDADLRFARLSNANLKGVNLSNANLFRADLSGAALREANLSDANLRRADLRGADLGGGMRHNFLSKPANLRGADLRGSTYQLGAQGIITNEELEQQAASLKGATMPNGQKYEDWLKSKNQEEGKKSDGSS